MDTEQVKCRFCCGEVVVASANNYTRSSVRLRNPHQFPADNRRRLMFDTRNQITADAMATPPAMRTMRRIMTSHAAGSGPWSADSSACCACPPFNELNTPENPVYPYSMWQSGS